MKRLLAGAGMALSLFAAGAFADTWNGTISDDACAAKHVNSSQADINCAASCIKNGGSAVLVVGDKIFRIENKDAIKGHEGHKVTVTGRMTGDTIHVDSVKM
jgi:hypothetical protein